MTNEEECKGTPFHISPEGIALTSGSQFTFWGCQGSSPFAAGDSALELSPCKSSSSRWDAWGLQRGICIVGQGGKAAEGSCKVDMPRGDLLAECKLILSLARKIAEMFLSGDCNNPCHCDTESKRAVSVGAGFLFSWLLFPVVSHLFCPSSSAEVWAALMPAEGVAWAKLQQKCRCWSAAGVTAAAVGDTAPRALGKVTNKWKFPWRRRTGV